MNHEKLIAEVKNEYARLADSESQEQVRQTTTDIPPGAYYEQLLSKVKLSVKLTKEPLTIFIPEGK